MVKKIAVYTAVGDYDPPSKKFHNWTDSSLYLLIQFWLCYRTIYVPYENAVNVPDIFDVSVGAGFGYSDQPPVTKSPAAVQSSYDNPISSFDAPIYDENSYTAEAVSLDWIVTSY